MPVVFIVTEGQHGILLSYDTSCLLGILSRIRQVTFEGTSDALMRKIVKQFPALFTEKIGLIREKAITLYINQDIRPVRQSLRPIPFHYRDAVSLELTMGLEHNSCPERKQARAANKAIYWIYRVRPDHSPERVY